MKILVKPSVNSYEDSSVFPNSSKHKNFSSVETIKPKVLKILVLNCGSSSIKAKLFANDECLISFGIEEIGGDSKIKYKLHDKESEIKGHLENHKEALNQMMVILKENFDLSDIECISHRIVNGGENFIEPVLVDDEVVRKLEEIIYLAPLHNPASLAGIKLARELFPGKKNIVIFDTAFHSTIPEKAFLYGLPYDLYEKYTLRKFGFHGTSHRYVVNQVLLKLNNSNAKVKKLPEDNFSLSKFETVSSEVSNPNLKIISCHLGNGSSVAASIGGKCADTSMGFTPLDGLAMGTRSGSVDPSIITFLMEKENMGRAELEHLLNKKSGMLGISKLSSDMRVLNDEYDKNKLAKLAIDLFAYQVLKFIGAYAAVMNGIDALVFTGGIGENDWRVRELILENLTYLGITFDKQRNMKKEEVLSSEDSKIPVYIIKTNEELQMARESRKLIETNFC